MKTIVDELKHTYEDILTLGESHQRIELFDGECIMTAMPSTQHQRIATRLGIFLGLYIDKHNIGVLFSSPVDVYLSKTTVFQPDVSFLSFERSYIDDGKKLNGAPDLAVEILSESTEDRDRTFKFREYAIGGAKEYWMVSPEKKEIEVYQNSDRGFKLIKIFKATDILNSPLLNEININVAAIFV